MSAARKQNTVRKAAKTNSSSRFFALLGVAGVAGVALIAWLALGRKPQEGVAVDPKLVPSTFQPYTLGSPNAPVTITEFADFECPGCANFATITEPDVRKRLVETGQARFEFYPFPLNIHKNTWDATLAAACANDQGNFWEMHDRIFQAQDQWAGHVTSNPRKVLRTVAQEAGLDLAAYDQCMESEKHRPAIQASYNYAVASNIQQTPSFIIGGKVYLGSLPYDEIKRIVDEAARNAPAAATATAATATAATATPAP